MIHCIAGLDWLLSSGGNLMVLPEELVPVWRGAQSDDFDRACDVEEYVGLVSVANDHALALGGEPLATAVYFDSTQPDTAYVLRWMRGDCKAVQMALSLLPKLRYISEDIRLTLPSGNLILTDAASVGTRKHLRLAVPFGTYTIATCHYLPDPLTYFVVHRFDFLDEEPFVEITRR